MLSCQHQGLVCSCSCSRHQYEDLCSSSSSSSSSEEEGLGAEIGESLSKFISFSLFRIKVQLLNFTFTVFRILDFAVLPVVGCCTFVLYVPVDSFTLDVS